MQALEVKRPLHRRLGRGVLRLFRPLVQPFLHRLELRVRAGVDQSETSASLRRLEAAHQAAQAQSAAHFLMLRHDITQLNNLVAGQARLQTEVLRLVEEQHTDIKIRLDALSLSHLRVRTFKVQMTALEDRLETGLKAAETSQARLLAQVTEWEARQLATDETGLACLYAVRDALTAGLTEAAQNAKPVADAIAALLGREDTRDEQVAALLGRSETAIEQLSGLLQRTGQVLPLGPDLAVRTDYGFLLVPVEDVRLLVAMVETSGRLEPGTLSLMESLLHPGGFMVDVGAHVGTLCLPAIRRLGVSGHILALEPTPRTAGLLRRSLVLNEVEDQVTVLECAAGETNGQGILSLSGVAAHNSLLPLEKACGQVEVEIRSLDACVPAGQKVDLVKVDAEGAELQVWRGMRRIIAENPSLAVIVEFGPSHLQRAGTTITDWLAELREPGFTPWEIEEATGKLRPLRANGLEKVFSVNLLLLRDAPQARAGLQLA